MIRTIKQYLLVSCSKFFRTPINVFLIFLILFFSLGSQHFFSAKNFYNILVQGSIIGTLALGLSFVIINGNIDLSVGSVLGLCTGVFVTAYNATSLYPAILATIGVGILVGIWNGFCVWILQVNAFIVTLASMIGARGLLFMVTKEQSISLKEFSFTEFSSFKILGLSALSWIYIIFMCILVFVQVYTVHGRNVMFVGGNKKAARAAGINIGLHQLINFVICSIAAAIAAILLTAQLGSATPVTGRQYELWAIASVALGGVKLAGGEGKVSLVFLGGITVAILRNGMSLMRISTAYVFIITGLVLLAVMLLSQYLEHIEHFISSYLKKKRKIKDGMSQTRGKL